MDETVAPRLPRYVFKRANGTFRYKRNVPKELRDVILKDTVYRQLGRTYQDAMLALPKVHAEIEALFDLERRTTDGERARALVREHLGEWYQTVFTSGELDPEWDVFGEIEELAEKTKGAVPKGVTKQLRAGQYEAPVMTLKRVLETYSDYKADDMDDGFKSRIERIQKDLVVALGKVRFEHADLKDIGRADAKAYRDLLLARMSPNSVLRYVGTLKAAISYVILEYDLNIRNPFQSLPIKGAGRSKTDRLPITDDQLNLLWPAYESSAVARVLFCVLADTGARLSEITGLSVADVDIDNRVLHIRANEYRSLKTKTSERSIPLSQRATECLQEAIVGLSMGAPIFETYARPRGNDNASAMLMKRLRTVITDKKVTIHSLRHRMKDRLRNTGCPETISMAILGHSNNTIAANYGAGYALEVMREHMERAWAG